MDAVIASLLATLQLLLAALGSHVEIERAFPDPSPLGTVTGDTTCARWVWEAPRWTCPDKVWRVRVAPTLDFAAPADIDDPALHDLEQRQQARALNTLVHELAHAYDGMDDGEFNGSPATASRGSPRRGTAGRATCRPTPRCARHRATARAPSGTRARWPGRARCASGAGRARQAPRSRLRG